VGDEKLDGEEDEVETEIDVVTDRVCSECEGEWGIWGTKGGEWECEGKVDSEEIEEDWDDDKGVGKLDLLPS